MQFTLESTFDNFSASSQRYIYIYRSLEQICRSARARSVDPGDQWSEEKGVIYNILLYNASCRQILHLYETREEIFSSIIFVNYRSVFTSLELAHGLFDCIGASSLNASEAEKLKQFVEMSSRRVTASSAKDYKDDVTSLVNRFLDRAVHNSFVDCMKKNSVDSSGKSFESEYLL